MKKTVLLLTTVFALGVLVYAQNDCTNGEVQKTKKEKMMYHGDYHYLSNPTDCSNPEKIAYYMTDGFDMLLSSLPELNSVNTVSDVKTIFSQSSKVSIHPDKLCCTPPPETIHRSQLNPNDRQ